MTSWPAAVARPAVSLCTQGVTMAELFTPKSPKKDSSQKAARRPTRAAPACTRCVKARRRAAGSVPLMPRPAAHARTSGDVTQAL
jgi:hypothetical protein